MPTYHILCLSQRLPLTHAWYQEIQARFAHVVEMKATESLDVSTLSASRLIIIDIAVVDNETIDLCKQLRARFSRPLLAMVSQAGEQELLALYDAGVDECIAQSIPPSLLVAKISRWMLWTRAATPNQLPRLM